MCCFVLKTFALATLFPSGPCSNTAFSEKSSLTTLSKAAPVNLQPLLLSRMALYYS